jgi:PIN domain nuclease of toxin-antitoxin system
VRVLLDTHAFLWAITDNRKLSSRARDVFTSPSNELFLSVSGVWEIMQKAQIGKLPLPSPAGAYLTEHLVKTNVQVFPIRLNHVLRLEFLPRHHRDPFDRILVAQSIEENLPILTADPLLKNYSVTLIW